MFLTLLRCFRPRCKIPSVFVNNFVESMRSVRLRIEVCGRCGEGKALLRELKDSISSKTKLQEGKDYTMVWARDLRDILSLILCNTWYCTHTLLNPVDWNWGRRVRTHTWNAFVLHVIMRNDWYICVHTFETICRSFEVYCEGRLLFSQLDEKSPPTKKDLAAINREIVKLSENVLWSPHEVQDLCCPHYPHFMYPHHSPRNPRNPHFINLTYMYRFVTTTMQAPHPYKTQKTRPEFKNTIKRASLIWNRLYIQVTFGNEPLCKLARTCPLLMKLQVTGHSWRVIRFLWASMHSTKLI